MKERPIIFSPDMIRAIMAKRKTMTRRVLKPQPPFGKWDIDIFTKENNLFAKFTMQYEYLCSTPVTGIVKCPYGQPGDRLWVRETFANFPDIHGGPNYNSYKADLNPASQWKDKTKWRPAIFMPRSAARLFLEITDCRLEPLQDITKSDSISEGIYWSEAFPEGYTIGHEIPGFGTAFGSAEGCYKALWDSLNLRRGFGFETNPYVWVISFKQLPSPSSPSIEYHWAHAQKPARENII